MRHYRTGIAGAAMGIAMVVAGAPTAFGADTDQDGTRTERAAAFNAVGGAQAKAGGARSGDWTGDGIPDVLARTKATGDLVVYPHSGSFDGLNTYQEAVPINHGWTPPLWIGQGDISGDGMADALTVTDDGALTVYPHSGKFDGTNTLGTPDTLMYGWESSDLIFTGDVDGDGFDDMIARRTGTGDTYFWRNTGGINGTQTFEEAKLLAVGGENDVHQTFADVTLDGNPDLVYVLPNGTVGVISLVDGKVYDFGGGWDAYDAVVSTEVNSDGNVDFLTRRIDDGTLQAHAHSGTFDPEGATLNDPVDVGYNAGGNDVIS